MDIDFRARMDFTLRRVSLLQFPGRMIRRLRLKIGNDYYGSMRWRIFVEGDSLQLYISSVEITLDPTLFDDYARVLEHEPRVVGIGRHFHHIKVNFKMHARHFSTRCIVNLDQSRTDRSFFALLCNFICHLFTK